jgi:fumigallin biosynthesis monooxygenase-like protein
VGGENMARVIPDRMTAEIEGDFVVFLIGMRVNKPWKIHKWLPVFLAMPPMLKELEAHPESGFLGCIRGFAVIVQYWRSFDHLESYARSQDQRHWPAWVAFNKRTGSSRHDVGIWHETYQVRDGAYETVYSGMPPFGLGSAGKLVPAKGRRESARGRFVRSNAGEPASAG